MDTKEARAANRSSVLWALLQRGVATREELATTADLSAATVSRVLDSLIADGLVQDAPSIPTGRRGRRVTPVQFVGDAGTAVGVDLGGSNCRFLAVDLLGRVRARRRRPTPTKLGAAALATWVRRQIDELVGTGDLRAVAVGLPGMVHPATGEVRAAPNLTQLEGLGFVEALRQRLDVPVSFDNDSNLACLGELRLGNAAGCTSAVMFTIGTGLGCGVVLEGRLMRGRTGLVGELGYLPLGGDGATLLEEALSATGLVAAAARRGLPIETPAAIFADKPPAPLRGLRQRFERALLLALAVATTAYEPEVIVIGGGISSSLEPLLAILGERLGELLPETPRLALSALGDPAGAVGAVISALQQAYLVFGVNPAMLDGSFGPGLVELAQAGDR